jgi:predicted nuclease of predicted toxin-antitoxin system
LFFLPQKPLPREAKTDSYNPACPFGGTVKLLIDECLHTSLIELAHAAGHVADHVNYLGLGSSKDWQLMATIRAQDYTFVTNNRSEARKSRVFASQKSLSKVIVEK